MNNHIDRIMHHKYLGEDGFGNWLSDLKDVIEADGYEENEFEVFSDHWYPYYTTSMPPQEAWHKITKQGKFHNG